MLVKLWSHLFPGGQMISTLAMRFSIMRALASVTNLELNVRVLTHGEA